MRYGLLALCAVLGTMIPAWSQPLASFEEDSQASVVSPSGLVATRVAEHASAGQYSLRLQVKGSEKDSWPGVMWHPASPDLSGVTVLAADFYNAESFPVALSYRLDDNTGKNLFGGAELAPGKMTTVEIWLPAYRYQLDLRNMKQVLLYFRMPRRDLTVYLDNLRYVANSARFRPLVYRETAPQPEVAAAETARGYVLFARHWSKSVFPNSRPLAGERQPRLAGFACPGQTVPLTLSLWALRDLGPTQVTVTELKSGKATLPASIARVYPVRCLDKRVVYSSDSYLKDMPVLLEERPSVAVAAGRAQSYWLDVAVPVDAAPGLYEGQALVKPASGEATAVPVKLRVLPFKLAEPRHMFWGEYYTGPKFVKTPEETNAAVVRELTDQRAHGMTSVGMCWGLGDKEFAVKDGEVLIQPDPSGRYVAFMNAYKRLGFPMPVIQLNDGGQAAAAGERLGTEAWKKLYQGYWIALRRYHQVQGWPEVIIQPVDEPGWQGPDERERNVICLKALKEVPGLRTEQDGPGDGYFLNVAGPFADVWNFNGALPAPDVLAGIQKKGKIVLTYNNDVESYRPECDRYVCGFYQLRSGARGAFNWEYMGFGGSPYDDQDAPEDSWVHRYPAIPELGEVGGFSTGWQGTREGVTDFRFAHTLQQAVARGLKSRSRSARTAAQRGQQALASLVSTLDYRPATRGTAQWTGTETAADGTRMVTGQLKMPNGWDFETYDQARWQLAAATWDIMAALGETKSRSHATGSSTPAASALLQDVQWTVRPVETVARTGGGKQVSVPLVEQGPRCDGDLTDAVWAKAADLGPFTLADGKGAPSQQTKVRVCADQQYLYFGVECLEETIGQLTGRVSQDGGPVWSDDCVEFFFDSTLQRSSYRQIIVNCLGKIGWNNPADKNWKPDCPRAARVDKEGRRWFVEMGVPLAALELTSSAFGLNVCRERRPLESLELSCWSPTGGMFAAPDRFGTASLGGSYLGEYRLGPGWLGPNELQVSVRNESPQPRDLLVLLDWRQKGSMALYRQKGPLTLKPGETTQESLRYDVVTDRQPVDLALTVKDTATGQVLAQRRAVQPVLPGLKVSLTPRLYYLSETRGALQAQLNLAPELRQRAVLMLLVWDASGKKLLRKMALSQLQADQLNATLNLAGLAAGTYHLEAVLKAGPEATAKRLSTVKLDVVRVTGPFD